MCISLGILGIALCISGWLLGATMETVRSIFGLRDVNARFLEDHYENSVREAREFSEDYDGEAESYDDANDREYTAPQAGQQFSDIRELEIDVTRLDVEILEWDGREILVDTGDMGQDILDDLEISHKDGELKIELKNKKKWENLVYSVYEPEGTLLIQIPAGQRFREASVKVGKAA